MSIRGKKWFVTDRYGNKIYLTTERWQHIIKFHPELIDHFDQVLDTLKTGRRRQKPLTPNEYKYLKSCDTLPMHYNAILVVVAFTQRTLPDGTVIANNFVKTVWGVCIHRLDRGS